MSRSIPVFVGITSLLWCCAGVLGACPPKTGIDTKTVTATRILFVGNSYTAGRGGMGDLVQRMAAEHGIDVEVEQVTGGGYTLYDHWLNSLGTRDRIAAGNWDWVVLQEQSQTPFLATDFFFTHARLLDEEIRAVGARTMFFLTWAREWAPETQIELDDAYCSIASELGAAVATVGMAWASAREQDTDIALHGGDGSHQGPLGQYLAGLIFHRELWGASLSGLSHDVSPHLSVSAADAAFLQQVASTSGRCETLFDNGFESGNLDLWHVSP